MPDAIQYAHCDCICHGRNDSCSDCCTTNRDSDSESKSDRDRVADGIADLLANADSLW